MDQALFRAYGLTDEEILLMWRTAPPRMSLAAPASAAGSEAGVETRPDE